MKVSTDYKVNISVIIAVYNVDNYIEACFNSLLAQSFKNLEFILIDDFSTDKSGEFCEKYASIDSRFKVVHNSSNLGQGRSFNLAINIAKGDYFSFIDPDDWVDIDFYEKLYSAALKNDSDIVKTGLATINQDGILKRSNSLVSKINTGLINDIPLNILFTQEYTTAIYRRSVIINNVIKFPGIRNALDIIFLLQITYYAKSFTGISSTYYNYRLHNLSKSRTHTISYFQSILKCFQLHIDFINTHSMDKKSYDFLFYRGLIGVIKRFPLLSKNNEIKKFKQKYSMQTLQIMRLYKNDPGILLNNLVVGIYRQENLFKIKESIPFRILAKVINVLRYLRNMTRKTIKNNHQTN